MMIRKRGQLWHKRWHGHALNGTQGLTLEEQGAYTRLLDTMYDQGGPVRDSVWNLCAVLGVDPRPAKRLRTSLVKAGKLEAVKDAAGGEWLVNDRAQSELKLPTSAELRADFGAKSAIANADVTPSEPKKPKENSKTASRPKAENGSRRKRKEERPPTPKGETVSQAVAIWNEAAARSEMPRCVGLSDKREKAIGARLAEHGMDGWRKAVDEVEHSTFCRGSKGWRATVDYVASPSGFLKLIEGGYERDTAPPVVAQPVDQLTIWRDRLARLKESNGRYWRATDWGPRPDQPGCLAPASVLDEWRAAA